MNIKERYTQKIINYIQPDQKVLDLGCGKGELLDQLTKSKSVKGYGIEINMDNILSCTKRGINVFQGNINEGLKEFSDKSFDVVVLSQTLQEVQDPLFVLNEMLRVGKVAIVTFPNFGYWKIRKQLLQGSAPVTKLLPYEWYNTPNIRLITLKDFRIFCKKHKLNVLQDIPLYEKALLNYLPIKPLSNLLSKEGLFILKGKK